MKNTTLHSSLLKDQMIGLSNLWVLECGRKGSE